jgi:hypothetical protein
MEHVDDVTLVGVSMICERDCSCIMLAHFHRCTNPVSISIKSNINTLRQNFLSKYFLITYFSDLLNYQRRSIMEHVDDVTLVGVSMICERDCSCIMLAHLLFVHPPVCL